jgi:ADP-heptose:LPS heptosyltransferase/predicted SAM-dependent methyltransferase
MTWQPNMPYRAEVTKCRHRLIPYCVGMGLDIGCGIEKIKPLSIGIDWQQSAADIVCDVGEGLTIFAPNSFDFIFSSHCLEDLEAPEIILRDWWSKLKVGGNLVLYLPDKSFYPNIGQEGCNPFHQNDFSAETILEMMDKFATYQVLHNETHGEADEYSFDIVLKKISDAPAVKINIPAGGKKTALVIRYGGFGDGIIASPLFKRLKQDGYEVTLNTTERMLSIVKNNPNIDHIMMQEDEVIPRWQLGDYWDEIGKKYDKVVNLSETLEVKFLTIHRPKEQNLPGHPGYLDYRKHYYYYPQEIRRQVCGKDNYYDYVLQVAGYTDVERPKGELYFDYREEAFCQKFRDRFKNYFVILWSLSGSAMHKAWLRAEETAIRLLSKHRDMVILTVGDYACKLIEWRHPQSFSMIDEWGIRASMLMTKYVDLVIAPETGILNAAGCFDTPQISLLTHSSKTNLTKYFTNDHSIQAHIDCSPCHKMVFMDNFRDCELIGGGSENGGIDFCACGDAFSPEIVIREVEEIYGYWRAKRKVFPIAQPRSTSGFLYGPDGKTILGTRRVAI